MAMHVRRGDEVMVTAGDDKGKVGTVLRVDADARRVYVKGVNLRTKHLKPTRVSPQGGVITKEAPIHISNVSPVSDGRPTRVRFEVGADGSKKRIAARTGKVIPVRLPDGTRRDEIRGAKKA